MFTLKGYQERALGAVETFFRHARVVGREQAWTKSISELGQAPRLYDRSALGEVPAVCVRIPTGGGKTYLAAHAVARIGQVLLDSDAPAALWLTPSDAIRTQTLAMLQTPSHPCRLALESHFGDRVRVCALEDLPTVGPQEVGASAIIIVATIQSFNVRDKTIRNAYAFDEGFSAHFQSLTP